MAFSTESFAELFSALGGGPLTSCEDDKRRAQRLPHKAELTVVPYTDAGPAKPVTMQLRDLSPRGLRLSHIQPLKRGEEFIVLLPRKNGKPLPIHCTVMHCKPVGNRFSIGAEFNCVTQPKKASSPTQDRANLSRIRESILD